MTRRVLWALGLGLALLLVMAVPLSAHVGSPDVFFEGTAGSYRVLVAISAPAVVPGVAAINVRVLDGSPRDVKVVPLKLTGPGAQFAPVSDRAARSDVDPQTFTANLWMMESGAWQVRITIDGDRGTGQVSVPVDALASRTLSMDRGIALVLLPIGAFLVFGFVAIVGASVGQAQADPGQTIAPARVRRARIARIVAFGVALLVLFLSNKWWDLEAKAYDEKIYKPLALRPQLDERGWLQLRLQDPGWLKSRVLDDLVPDHGHEMHLFAVRTPALDTLLHLHPQQHATGGFSRMLPKAPAGTYRLFADVVHATGLPETAVADITLPAIENNPPVDDDSEATEPAATPVDPNRLTATLSDGGVMTWERERGFLKAKQPYLLKFRVDEGNGTPARDLMPYMGMPGHAIVLRRDLSVFAHVHPFGTASMASLALASADAANPHAQHMQMPMPQEALPPTVSFPYGFPREGDYRLFVQVKRASGVQTGIFDVHVD
jgi:hypothetical protein